MSDYIQRNIGWGEYELAETELIKGCLTEGGTFVDVGANIGYYTALAASVVGPAGNVLSFEPDPFCFNILAKNFGGTSFINCINMAVSDSVGSLKLFMPPESEHNHDSSWLAYCDGMTTFECKTTTLDIELKRFERVQLLKMDIEGHEPQVIQGGKRTLQSGKIERVLCELNERLLRLAGSSTEELLEIIQGCGFELEERVGSSIFSNALFRHRSTR